MAQSDITQVRSRLLERFERRCWFVDLAYADGSLGHLELTVTVAGDFEEGFRIQGEHGSVNGRLPISWYHKSGYVECFSTSDDLYTRPPRARTGTATAASSKAGPTQYCTARNSGALVSTTALPPCAPWPPSPAPRQPGADWVALNSISGGV